MRRTLILIPDISPLYLTWFDAIMMWIVGKTRIIDIIVDYDSVIALLAMNRHFIFLLILFKVTISDLITDRLLKHELSITLILSLHGKRFADLLFLFSPLLLGTSLLRPKILLLSLLLLNFVFTVAATVDDLHNIV